MSWKGFVKQLEGQIDKVLDIQPGNADGTSNNNNNNWGLLDWDNPLAMTSTATALAQKTAENTSTAGNGVNGENAGGSSDVSIGSFLPKNLAGIQSNLQSMLKNVSPITIKPASTGEVVMPDNHSIVVADTKVEVKTKSEELVVVTEKTVPESVQSGSTESKLQSVIEERENQLGRLNQQNAGLNNTVTTLTDKVSSLEQQIHALTQKLSDRDAKIQRLEQSSSETTGGNVVADLENLVAKKEESIAGLIKEGQDLALSNGKLSEALKKLKQKYQERDESFKLLEKKYINTQNDAVASRERISVLENSEKKAQVTVKSLSEMNDQLRKQSTQLENEVKEAKEKQSSLQVTLDRAWQELSELRKSSAVVSAEAQSAELEKERSVLEKVQKEFDEYKGDAITIQNGLKREINDLRSKISQLEDEIGWKEDSQRREILSFQQKLQAADLRNEDLSQSIQEATKPLLRQIESLQQHNHATQQTFKSLEVSLSKQINDLMVEKDELNSQIRITAQSIADMERQLASARREADREGQERDNLARDIEGERNTVKQLKEQLKDTLGKLETVHRQNEASTAMVKAQVRDILQLEYEEKISEMTQKMQRLELMTLEKEKEVQRLKMKISDIRAKDNASSPTSPMTPTPYAVDIHQNFRISSLENQVAHLEQQLKTALDAKEELSENVANITSEYNRLKSDNQTLTSLQTELENLKQRHGAALELLGEKTEQVSELRQDILEMKEVYKTQIQELVAKIENSGNL